MSMSPEEILSIATKLGLLSNDTPRKGKTEEKPAPRKKPAKPVEIKEPQAQRTFGQSKAIRTLLGFYAPFGMSKGVASALIDKATNAVVAGKEDSIVIDDALQAALVSLEDEYVNAWVASGCKLRGHWQPPKKPAKTEEPKEEPKSELEEQLLKTLKDVEEFIPPAKGYAKGLYAGQDELWDALSKSQALNTLVWALILQNRKNASEE